MKNNLIALLDVTFPDANRLFNSPRRADGSEKWLDFLLSLAENEDEFEKDLELKKYR